LTLVDCILSDNRAQFVGGGILNNGTATLIRTTLEGNRVISDRGGGLMNLSGASVTIADSTFVRNRAELGGGLANVGTATITNTTFAQNSGNFGGGDLSNMGRARLLNTTFAENTAGSLSRGVGGGITNFGDLEMENTIVARNEFVLNGFPVGPADCSGPVTSLGHNLIGDLTGCTITLKPGDLTGDAGLGDFTDDGAPGNGRFPLLASNPAIDVGNEMACSATDQLGPPRLGACDIGAIEFYPVVNDLVALANLSTDFDPAPVPNGPAGTFRITAEFINTSNQAIVNPFVEVVELTGGNLLLNANGGVGGVGARLTPPGSATNPFQPGASSTVEFLIGLQQREPFGFFVNMLGPPGASSPSISTTQWKSQPSSP
jgi:hypothetical protein